MQPTALQTQVAQIFSVDANTSHSTTGRLHDKAAPRDRDADKVVLNLDQNAPNCACPERRNTTSLQGMARQVARRRLKPVEHNYAKGNTSPRLTRTQPLPSA